MTPLADRGPEDQLGAANEVTPEVVLRAIGLVTEGRVFDLSQPLSSGSPRLPDVQSPYSLCLWSNPYIGRQWYRDHEGATNDVSFADERVSMDLHTGTHIDALAHAWVGEETYNGHRFNDVLGNWGLKKLGIEHVPPLVCRGLLIDVPAYRGRELEPGEVITAEDVEGALGARGLQVRPGDIALIRTGWSRYYGVNNAAYVGASPGIGVRAAESLAESGVVAVGADTMGLEVYPGEQDGILYPVHQFLLARAGVHIIEQAMLDDIAAEGVGEFLCVCAAPKFEGATAAPVRLTAVI
ncbi:MAG: cyclase family protein [Actinomycetota bacterium]